MGHIISRGNGSSAGSSRKTRAAVSGRDPDLSREPETGPELDDRSYWDSASELEVDMVSTIRFGKKGNPDRGLSFGDVALESLRKWQHGELGEPRLAQVDAHLGTSMSFRELLLQTVHATEGWLAMGLQRGDVVALVSRNYHEVFPATLGAVCAGLSVACIVPSSTVVEMRHALSLAAPKVVLSESSRLATAMAAAPQGSRHMVLDGEPPEGVDSYLRLLRSGEAAEPPPDPDKYRAVDVGDRTESTPFILFSSGTTGLPKGVRLRDSCLTILNDNLSLSGVLPSEPCINLISSPLCWITGVWQLLFGICFGHTRVFTTVSDDVTLLRAIDKYKVNTWVGAPAVLISMVSLYKARYRERFDLSSLGRVLTGGSAMGSAVQAELEADLGCRLIQVYGATEAGFVFGPMLGCPPCPPGSIGQLQPWVELRLVSLETGKDIATSQRNVVGEARVRSPYLLHSYVNNPEETAKALDEQGFYRTGDLLHEDEEGHYYFVDRIKEMIKYKNNQIAPTEVEMTLLQHPGVREACVLGRASTADIGDVPIAFVVRAANDQGASVTEDELKDLVAGTLSDYKQLRGGIVFLDQLPKTVSGKVARHKIKEMLRAM